MKLYALIALASVVPLFGQGTVPPLNTWVNTVATGYPSTPVGFDKAVYVSSKQAVCYQTNYLTRGVTSEIQDAIICYDYAKNWLSIPEQGGGPHSLHSFPGGHSVSVVDYYQPADAFVLNSDNSYANNSDVLGDWWVWYVAGMTMRDAPLPTHSSNAGQFTRAWLSPNNQLNAASCNQNTGKCLIHNDYRQGGSTGAASLCTINSLGVLTSCVATSATNNPNVNSHNLRWNPDDGKHYAWGGGLSSVRTYDEATDTWAIETTTCVGPDCVGNQPPLRHCAGFDFSTADHLFLLVAGRDLTAGCSSGAGVAYVDTWTYNPVTKVWTEKCGPGMAACGYPNSNPNGWWDKLAYDQANNVFLGFPYTGTVWAYALSTPLAYGRSTPAYNPAAGSLNRTSPGVSNTVQGNSFDVSATVAGGVLYVSHAETDQPNGSNSNCKVPTVYTGTVDNANAATYLPGGTTVNGCTSARFGEWTAMPMSHPYAAVLSGTVWRVFEKHNSSGLGAAASTRTFYQRYNGSTWDGGWAPQTPGVSLVAGVNTITLSPMPTGVGIDSVLLISGGNAQAEYVRVTAATASTVTFSCVRAHGGAWTAAASGYFGCFTKNCQSLTADPKIRSFPTGLTVVGSTIVASVIEEDTNALPHPHKLWVAQMASGNWSAIGSAALNVNTTNASHVTYASQPATDGSGNIAICFTEEIEQTSGSAKTGLTMQPQAFCKTSSGGAFSLMGAGTINRTSSNWAYLPSIVFHNGSWYAAHTESTQGGPPQVFVQQYNGSTWGLVGSGTLNIDSTNGLAYHPTLATDGTDLYVAWEEQASVSSRSQSYVKKWNGSAWSSLGGAIAADTSNGSTQNTTIVMVGSTPTVVFEEIAWGSLRQVYRRVWTGSAWGATTSGSTCTISTLSLPGGFVGATYSQQIGTAGCASPSFSVTAGSLPAGLSLSSGGLLSGTPATAGSSNFTVTVSDANGNPSQAYTVSVSNPGFSVGFTVQELLCSGCPTSGIARTNEPTTFGTAIPDSAGIITINSLGLSGATAAQFSPLGYWPSGNIKWLKVSATMASVSAGGTGSLTLTNQGSGNFGGSNLAVDNGSTITVSTGTSTFVIKKANFNIVDSVSVGATSVVQTGASAGIVLLGPDPAAAYPGNVTCSPTSGGTACNTLYTSANDANSTVTIDDNGPALCVLRATGTLKDSAGHAYMGFTQYLTFAKSQDWAHLVTVLRNADYGTSSTFASASKGYQGLELRVTANISGTLSYSFANHTATTTGSLTSGQYAYLYQAESNQMKNSGWCSGLPGCVVPSSLSGYTIIANGSQVASGTASQYPTGWADISNASGVGVEIGQYYLAGYGNKSLEFRNGGSDVRIGLWASENNTTSLTTLTPNAPYYLRWPQWDTQEAWMIFHSSALSSPANEHLKRQHPLVARPTDPAYLNTTAAIAYPLLTPTEEDTYYSDVFTNASPSVTSRTASDLAFGTTSNSDLACSTTVCAWRYWRWPQSGGANQMEFRRGLQYRFNQRGFTGGLIQAKNWYRLVGDKAWPQSDGFNWRDKSAGEKQYYDFPTATSTNSSLALSNQIENSMEHGHMQGLLSYYWFTGDSLVKEYADAWADGFLNGSGNNLYWQSGGSPAVWNSRALGNVFLSLANVYDYLSSTGQSADAATIKTRAQSVFTNLVLPDLCAYSGYPTGCTPDNLSNTPQVGTSKVRGVTNQWKDTSVSLQPGCSGIIPSSVRTQGTFMVGRMIEGMYEWSTKITSSDSYYYQFLDYLYGTVQWGINEMYADNGSQTVWTGNGWRYKQAVDYPNTCNESGGGDFSVKNIHPGMWFFVKSQYDGSTTSWKRLHDFLIQKDSADGTIDELFHYVVSAPVYAQLHPPGFTLTTLPLTGFTDLGGGSYRLQWTVPSGANSYRIKWGSKTIVDWIGFDAGSYTFSGNPATQQNWFASTDASNIPTPGAAGTTDAITVSTGTAGLSSSNFMVKASVGGCAISTSGGGPYTATQSVSATFTQNGCASSSWSATGLTGSGLSINSSSGVLSGTAVAGSYNAVISYDTADFPLTLTINAAPSITSSSPLPGGTVGVVYSQTVASSGGTAPLAWSISSGSLPTGLTLNSSTGLISGTPTTAQTLSPTIRITDANGIIDSKALSITIAGIPNQSKGATISGRTTLTRVVISQ